MKTNPPVMKYGAEISMDLGIRVLLKEKKKSDLKSYNPRKFAMITRIGDGGDDFEYEQEFPEYPEDIEYEEFQKLVYSSLYKQAEDMRNLMLTLFYAHFHGAEKKDES